MCRTIMLARKMPSTAQKEINDMVAPGLSTTMKSIRLNISPSSAPASKPLSAAQAMRALPDLGGTPALGNVAQAVSATSSLAGAPPLARKYNPNSMFKPAISQKVGWCPISGIRMNWQASTPLHAPIVFHAYRTEGRRPFLGIERKISHSKGKVTPMNRQGRKRLIAAMAPWAI